MPTLGLCSWSLHPSSVDELVERVRATGLTAVQLALTPIAEGQAGWDERRTVEALRGAGIKVLSGMLATIGEDYSTLESIQRTGGVRPDGHWTANLERAEKVAAVAQRLGLRLVTFHGGFLPHDPADISRRVMLDRLREIGAVFAERGVTVAFETGQESAATLVGVMRELDAGPVRMGVNFDPANMILYGMGDPIDALRLLAPWVKQVHVKDALPTATPGTWGRETPVGQGAVDWRAFFSLIERLLPHVDAVIEREAGEKRVDDIKGAANLVRSLYGGVRG
ncbi:MAG TPA: sugar phosphate isomerase/epimerase family protein [Phycisphaerales bacterium]|nr:sugar phosphate isomerase/epimerase family protein [Phycisphaerales bacterium]